MATTIVKPNYRPHEKQILLHNAPVSTNEISITLYGGTRGGGKSAGILGDAVLFAITYPGAKCVIFRESIDAVKQSFLDKLPRLFPQEVDGQQIYEYKENSTKFYPSRCAVFPNGSYITFQRCANLEEAIARQGYEFNYLAIDEVTKHKEEVVNALLTTVRSASVFNPYTEKMYQIPTKVVFGCNPGGIGHGWVKKRFIDPCVLTKDPVHNTPLKTRDHTEYVKHPFKDNINIKINIRFIPANFMDNPFLDDSYVAMLMKQSAHKQEMDIWGNWDIVAGKFFDLKKDQIIKNSEAFGLIKRAGSNVEFYISIDWGYNPGYHCALWHAVMPNKTVITFKCKYGQNLIFEKFVEEVAQESEGYEIAGTLLPHDMYRGGESYKDDRGRIIGEYKSDVFDFWGLGSIGVESGKGKVEMRNDKIMSSTEIRTSKGEPKFLISDACQPLILEMDSAIHDENNPELIASGCADHAIDAYGLFQIFFSDEIAPELYEEIEMVQKSRFERRLEEDERRLEEQEENFSEDDDFCITGSLDN